MDSTPHQDLFTLGLLSLVFFRLAQRLSFRTTILRGSVAKIRELTDLGIRVIII